MKSLLCAFLCAVFAAAAAEPGDSVVVVYNSRLPDSRRVAEHYAAARNVPANQVLGLPLPEQETMSRAEYRDQLQSPLLNFLTTNQFWIYNGGYAPVEASVRYLVLCYGVPLRIAEDGSLIEKAAAKMVPELRRNGAAVDSELCTLPDTDPSLPRTGVLNNPAYGASLEAMLDPTNRIVMVARLDGPSVEIANHLVDKALDAETNGLWGRAYFDLRGLTNGNYKLGDEWIGAAANMSRSYGFDVVVDDQPETFPANFPMSQIALYAGWYDTSVSGPFTAPHVEFMPGAFAYHLYSYSAHSLRTRTNYWCGPLLADGATVTMGSIDEPFLEGTPNIQLFFARWLFNHFTFGEAAYSCQRAVSWQTTVIGDPLYRPFGWDPRLLHEALRRRHSKMIDWSHVRVVNLSVARGAKPSELIQYLKDPSVPQESAVLAEKLGDVYKLAGEPKLAREAYRHALTLDPTPLQRRRLEMEAGSDEIGH